MHTGQGLGGALYTSHLSLLFSLSNTYIISFHDTLNFGLAQLKYFKYPEKLCVCRYEQVYHQILFASKYLAKSNLTAVLLNDTTRDLCTGCT